MKNFKLMLGDCLERMKEIPDHSVDMVLCDLPYGKVTACDWDIRLPFSSLWEAYSRICKDDSGVLLFANQPFTSHLILSNELQYRCTWIWVKDKSGNFIQASKRPLKNMEEVVVFSRKPTRYFPIKVPRMSPIFRGNSSEKGEKKAKQGSIPISSTRKTYHDRYPTCVLTGFGTVRNTVHPTQKPVDLLEYLIKTYTREGDVVLDNTMGSGSTGVAAINTNRKFIGIEKDPGFYKIAKERIHQALASRESSFKL